MQSSGAHLDATVRIPVFEPFREVNAALVDLLGSFTAEDWQKPTVHADRNVKDLTAHLLQTTLNRVSIDRDRFRLASGPMGGIEELIASIQRENREFMRAMRWVSPRILIELLGLYDREMLAGFEGLDPDGEGIGVAWAGEAVSRNWFDVARMYTEKWHHQQQLRDATGRPPLYEHTLLTPVLETFARGLPYAFRSREAKDGTRVSLTLTGPVTLRWTLRRIDACWSLWSGLDGDAEASISMPADVSWRLWTKGMKPDAARARLDVRGDETMVAPITSFVAIMA